MFLESITACQPLTAKPHWPSRGNTFNTFTLASVYPKRALEAGGAVRGQPLLIRETVYVLPACTNDVLFHNQQIFSFYWE